MARPDASANDACRKPEPGTDPGVSQVEPADRVCGGQRSEKYAWAERVLGAQHYGELGKRERGVVRASVEKVTGMSVSQATRLIRGFPDSGVVRMAPYQRHGFQARYTAEDLALLAEVDRAHERLSGLATRRILQRECE